MLITAKNQYGLKLPNDTTLAELIEVINDLGIARVIEVGTKPGKSKHWVFLGQISVEDQLKAFKDAQQKIIAPT